MNNPIVDQIVNTLTNLRREVSTRGITAEADAMWQHALSLYKMRQPSHRTGGDMPFGAICRPSFADRREIDSPAVGFTRGHR